MVADLAQQELPPERNTLGEQDRVVQLAQRAGMLADDQGASDAGRTSEKRSMIDFKSHSQTMRLKNSGAA